MSNQLEIEQGIECAMGHCDTCGHQSRLFRGFAYKGGSAFAVYACRYMVGHPEHGLSMAVSLRG